MSSELCSQSIRNDTSPEHEEAPRLSFCDLLESTHWDAINSGSKNGKSRCSNEGLIFDFFGSHSGFSFTAPPTTHPPPENIIFCGKQMTPNKTSVKKNNFKKKVFNWIMPSSSSSSSSSSSKQRTKKQNIGPEYDSGKSRSRNRGWWMVMFGSVRVPNEMDLSDIKTRQKRRPPQSIKAFVAMFDDHQQQINKLATETKMKMKMKTKSSSSINGLIGLVRSFSCRI